VRHRGGRPHQGQQPVGGEEPEHGDRHRDEHTEGDRLDGGHRRAVVVALADPPGDRRGGGQAEAERHREDHGEKRLGDSHRGHRIGPQASDEERVEDAEEGLHGHLQDHRDGQEEHGPGQAAGREVVLASSQGFAERGPRAGPECRPGRLHVLSLPQNKKGLPGDHPERPS